MPKVLPLLKLTARPGGCVTVNTLPASPELLTVLSGPTVALFEDSLYPVAIQYWVLLASEKPPGKVKVVRKSVVLLGTMVDTSVKVAKRVPGRLLTSENRNALKSCATLSPLKTLKLKPVRVLASIPV